MLTVVDILDFMDNDLVNKVANPESGDALLFMIVFTFDFLVSLFLSPPLL